MNTPLTLLTALLLAPLAVSQAAETKRPNVLFILADDLGWSDTPRLLTDPQATEPNVKRPG